MNGPVNAMATLQADNEKVRVTLWQFPPGAATGHHVHGLDYVVVPLMDGILRIVDSGGSRLVPMKQGASYTRPAGVGHDVINAGPGDFAFVEIELKS